MSSGGGDCTAAWRRYASAVGKGPRYCWKPIEHKDDDCMAGFDTQTVRLEERTDGIALARIDVPDRSVNVLNPQLRSDLRSTLDHISDNSEIKLLVIRSDKTSGFIVGADVQEFTTITG